MNQQLVSKVFRHSNWRLVQNREWLLFGADRRQALDKRSTSKCISQLPMRRLTRQIQGLQFLYSTSAQALREIRQRREELVGAHRNLICRPTRKRHRMRRFDP